MVMPIMAKSMRPDNPNNEKEMLWLILFGNTPPNPRTTKLTPRIITSHRPILSTVLDEYFKFGVVITSLEGLIPNNCSICLLNIPAKIMNVPRINQKANIVSLPFLLVRLTAGVSRLGWECGLAAETGKIPSREKAQNNAARTPSRLHAVLACGSNGWKDQIFHQLLHLGDKSRDRCCTQGIRKSVTPMPDHPCRFY
jgi:hypothetical protein